MKLFSFSVSLLCCMSGALFALLPASDAFALADDSEQPIQITADAAELDEESGTAIYIGNVQMDQGSLRVTADRMTIYTEDDAVTRVEATSENPAKLAHYQQLPNPGDAMVHGDAKKITYYTAEEEVEFRGDSKLTQDADVFTGEIIRYDIPNRQVRASAKKNAGVTMTLQPKRVSGKSE